MLARVRSAAVLGIDAYLVPSPAVVRMAVEWSRSRNRL